MLPPSALATPDDRKHEELDRSSELQREGWNKERRKRPDLRVVPPALLKEEQAATHLTDADIEANQLIERMDTI